MIKQVTRIKRTISPAQRQLCVNLKSENLSFREIAQITGIHNVSIRSLYRRYLEVGSVMPTKKPGRTPWPIPEDVEHYLKNGLFENRFLSLRDRVSDIQEKFGFYLSYNRLRNFFLRNGIKYART